MTDPDWPQACLLLNNLPAPTTCVDAEPVAVPASLAVQSLASGLGEDDALQLSELQDLQVVNHYGSIWHHVVGQISRQQLSICLGCSVFIITSCSYAWNCFIFCWIICAKIHLKTGFFILNFASLLIHTAQITGVNVNAEILVLFKYLSKLPKRICCVYAATALKHSFSLYCRLSNSRRL